jgi:hypothetical protein
MPQRIFDRCKKKMDEFKTRSQTRRHKKQKRKSDQPSTQPSTASRSHCKSMSKPNSVPKADPNESLQRRQKIAKLNIDAEKIFCEAYGLDGCIKRLHNEAVPVWQKEYGLSMIAMCGLLYGQTYEKRLLKWRSQVVNYVAQTGLVNMSSQELSDLSKLPFACFDGGKSINVEEETKVCEAKVCEANTCEAKVCEAKSWRSVLINTQEEVIKIIMDSGLQDMLNYSVSSSEHEILITLQLEADEIEKILCMQKEILKLLMTLYRDLRLMYSLVTKCEAMIISIKPYSSQIIQQQTETKDSVPTLVHSGNPLVEQDDDDAFETKHLKLTMEDYDKISDAWKIQGDNQEDQCITQHTHPKLTMEDYDKISDAWVEPWKIQDSTIHPWHQQAVYDKMSDDIANADDAAKQQSKYYYPIPCPVPVSYPISYQAAPSHQVAYPVPRSYPYPVPFYPGHIQAQRNALPGDVGFADYQTGPYAKLSPISRKGSQYMPSDLRYAKLEIHNQHYPKF